MMITTDHAPIETPLDLDPHARRGRVWKSPGLADRAVGRGPDSPFSGGPRAPRGSGLVGLATAGLIFAGGVAMSNLDDGPSPDPAPVIASDLPLGSMYHVVDQIGARELWQQGVTGAGVNVALIDTGVAPVDALADQVVATVDLSIEQGDPANAFVDNFGHGTHLAGIIAGRDPGADPANAAEHPEWFLGVAPDAGVVSVKVAGRDGAVAPASLLSGIDWVIDHADELDIGVITLALDTDTGSSYQSDPVAAALERAWDAGIVVVAAAGNDGPESNGLGSPAHDPYVIAVAGVEAAPDGFVVPDWASRGDAVRRPDLAAPGSHLVSLRAPGSDADVNHPEGLVDDQRFLGSGSSQSAAVVGGIAALLRSADPSLTPDAVKAALVGSATAIPGGVDFVGVGLVDAARAIGTPPTAATQTWVRSTADGSALTPVAAAYQFQPSGNAWMGNAWMGNAWMGNAWMGNAWMGNAWMGNAWMGNAWMGNAWMGNAWMGNAWMGNAWMGNAWMGNAWMGNAWMGNAWMGNAWMGNAWMGNAWMGNAWMGNAWMGNAWMGNAWMGNAWMGNAWMGNAWMGNAWMGNAWMGNAWMGNAWMGNAWMGNAWMGNAWMGNAWMGNAWMGNAWM